MKVTDKELRAADEASRKATIRPELLLAIMNLSSLPGIPDSKCRMKGAPEQPYAKLTIDSAAVYDDLLQKYQEAPVEPELRHLLTGEFVPQLPASMDITSPSRIQMGVDKNEATIEKSSGWKQFSKIGKRSKKGA